MDELKSLGKVIAPPHSGADASLLEKIPNPISKYKKVSFIVSLKGDEFTSVCPVTGAPDFGRIDINYKPKDWLVESKSLKLYMGSFRMQPTFHEEVVIKVCRDLADLLEPAYLSVHGVFKSRGGWSIEVEAETDEDD